MRKEKVPRLCQEARLAYSRYLFGIIQGVLHPGHISAPMIPADSTQLRHTAHQRSFALSSRAT